VSLPAPDGALDELCAAHRDDDGALRIVFPDGWQQGRGIFGGLVTAVMARALEASAPGRPLRSLTAELCGPLQPGAAVLVLESLRAGSAVTTAAVRVLQGGEVQAHGVGVLGAARALSTPSAPAAPPPMTAWRAAAPLPIPRSLGAPFARHFEFRVTAGLPFCGATVPEVAGWIRPLHPGARRDAAFVAACVDAYWPAILTLESQPRPMATIAFTLQPFADFDGLDPDAPLFFRGRLSAVDQGYAVEQRELWGEDGRLLALNQQTFVVIK
jgi:hypothetical protein